MKRFMYRVTIMAVFAAVVALVLGCNHSAPEEQPVTEDTFVSAPKEPPAYAIPINTPEDLLKIGKDSGYPLNGVYRLDGDITVTGNWTPLGGDGNFSGAFYGMDNTITLTGSGGIFASLNKATVYNLKVNVTATANSGNIGGIANYAENSLIEGCVAEVAITLTGTGHNASAGGIVGYMRNNVMVSKCAASGSVTLTSDTGAGLMVYAGGIAGYSGSGTRGGSSVITRVTQSSWNGTVDASGGYPYAGGIVGYNYTGGKITRCSSRGTVTANGGNLPYAGGVAGYNSGGDIAAPTADTEAVIENCYSTAAVTSVSASKVALAGGIAGANACRARISKCYTTGAVALTVSGSGTSDTGGSLGIMTAANAAGIAGAQYYKGPALIEYCAALNPSITAADGATAYNIYRIAGAGDTGADIGTFRGNIASSSMTINHHTGELTNDAAGKDGATGVDKPAQSAYTDMGWDFASVWTMPPPGYPSLK